MESHADSYCVDKHIFIKSIMEGMIVNAVPFEKTIWKTSDLLIFNAISSYDNPKSFLTILKRINHVIYIKDMKHALLGPNQARKYGTIIYNIPPHLDNTRTRTLTIKSGDYNFSLEQYGPAVYIHLIRPSEE